MRTVAAYVDIVWQSNVGPARGLRNRRLGSMGSSSDLHLSTSKTGGDAAVPRLLGLAASGGLAAEGTG